MLDTPPPRRSGGRPPRCRLACGFIAVLTLPLLVLGAHRAVAIDGWLREVVVAGPSMSPTLWGPSYRSQCPQCAAEMRFHSPAAPSRLRCWNCGSQQDPVHLEALAADRVYIDRAAYDWRLLGIPLRQSRPARGDLVAIEQSGALQVKRVLALPGDRLSLRGTALRVNDQPVNETLANETLASETLASETLANETLASDPPTVAVHRASIAQPSQLAGPPAPERRWQWQDHWLLYHHYSVHDRRVDRVRDDYAGNIQAARRLNAVDWIGVLVQLELQQDSTIEVVCWQSDQAVVYRRTFTAGKHCFETPWRGPSPSTDATPSAGCWEIFEASESAPVDALRPIAIGGLQPAANHRIELTVLRELHWFVDAAQRTAWPPAGTSITLGADRYFVGGDNQPLSIDSRAQPEGIAAQQIIGKVIPRSLK